MSRATVKSIDSTQNGGTKLVVQGQKGDWTLYPDKGISLAGISAGQSVEFEWFKRPNRDGSRQYSILKSIKASNGSYKTQDTGIDGLSEPALRFISNVVGSAITAKTLLTTTEVKIWALAAKEAYDCLAEKPKPKTEDALPEWEPSEFDQ